MTFWLVLFTANGWALLLLIQTLSSKDREQLAWLKRRSVVCAWLAFIAAVGVIGMCAYGIHYAYNVGGVPLNSSRTPAEHVSGLMQGILVALLLMLLPLGTRTIASRRAR